MTVFKKIFPLALLLSAGIATAQYTDQINSNRPGESMGAFSVGKTVMQVETGIYGIKEKHEVLNNKTKGLGLDLTLRYGAFLEQLEFVADIQYQFDQFEDAIYVTNRNDFRQFVIGAKYLIYDPNKNYHPEVNIYSWKANHKFKWHNLIPSVSIFAGANLIGKNNPYSFPDDGLSPKVIAITQNRFNGVIWTNNFIADKITTDYPSYGIISTLTRAFAAKWSGFVELQGYKSDFYADVVGRVGAAYLLNDSMQLDASISKNFKDTPSILYGGVGFSWRFDADYHDILLPSQADAEKDQSETDKKMKKKKEREEKDRLDNVPTE
ncbi:transporter [Flavobacterium sp. DG1-102-2]|uniref:transporter n=1 Tax=Flavobacterium sp. DG1-102-2 TaxID=3081663 RepID=UPI00294A6853|nr:transporter [Flavobacterium sp. DG1-102-2]MDV6168600.1 transporter [Flavobacterium sp. DG1-102-2]